MFDEDSIRKKHGLSCAAQEVRVGGAEACKLLLDNSSKKNISSLFEAGGGEGWAEKTLVKKSLAAAAVAGIVLGRES